MGNWQTLMSLNPTATNTLEIWQHLHHSHAITRLLHNRRGRPRHQQISKYSLEPQFQVTMTSIIWAGLWALPTLHLLRQTSAIVRSVTTLLFMKAWEDSLAWKRMKMSWSPAKKACSSRTTRTLLESRASLNRICWITRWRIMWKCWTPSS